MQNTINMIEIFSSLDKRKAEADSFIAMFPCQQVQEASRIASIYDNCDKSSLKHKEAIVKILKSNKDN